MEVLVDGVQPAPSRAATSVRVTLRYATGEIAEVQLAKVGYGLNVVMAGEVDTQLRRDQRGFAQTIVYPTKK